MVGIESWPRPQGRYSWRPLLERKEQLARTLDADWFIHMDADEVRLRAGQILVEAFSEAERQGFNAVNFLEFTFTPTREEPDHDHPHFECTMHWYYPFRPKYPHRLNVWRRQRAGVELAWSGGHLVRFPGLRMSPVPWVMKHYLFLSLPRLARKYGERKYDSAEGERGWCHRLKPERVVLPSAAELRAHDPEREFDASSSRRWHFIEEQMGERSLFKRDDWLREFPWLSRLVS